MDNWCMKCESSLPETEAHALYCSDCTKVMTVKSSDATGSERSASCSSQSRRLAGSSSSDASYETSSDYESVLATTVPSDSEPESIDDCLQFMAEHPLYQASPRFLAMKKSRPARLKAPLLLPMPSAPLLLSVQDNPLTPSDEPLSLPTSIPFFSSKTATAMLESAQEQHRSRMSRRNTDGGARPHLPRYSKPPSREAVNFYLGSEDEDNLGDGFNDWPNTRHKRSDSGMETPTRPRSVVASLSKLNLAGEAFQREGSSEVRRGRSREVSKKALYASERARSRQASSGSGGSAGGRQ